MILKTFIINVFVFISNWVLKENPSFAKDGLINSIKYENIEALNQLLLHPNLNLDVNCRDRFQKTPLHYASRNKLFPIVKMLIQQGADVNAYDDNNLNPLHEAAKSDSLEIVQLLLDNNVDNYAIDSSIKKAVQFNSIKVCKLLLQMIQN